MKNKRMLSIHVQGEGTKRLHASYLSEYADEWYTSYRLTIDTSKGSQLRTISNANTFLPHLQSEEEQKLGEAESKAPSDAFLDQDEEDVLVPLDIRTGLELALLEREDSFLEGFAHVINSTGENWNNVRVSLVTGNVQVMDDAASTQTTPAGETRSREAPQVRDTHWQTLYLKLRTASVRWHYADLCQDTHWQDDHYRLHCRLHDTALQRNNPGEGGDSA
jgi:hypothetical protein